MPKLGKVFTEEFLLSHFLDKTISTTLAVMFVRTGAAAVLGTGHAVKPQTGVDPKTIYHDLIELLGACYYVGLGVAIKTLEVQVAPSQPLLALLGRLGFFGALIAIPSLIELIGLH